jgi:hypothetical protein
MKKKGRPSYDIIVKKGGGSKFYLNLKCDSTATE